MLCRNADSSLLQQAVKDALLCTHVHPEGIEGAVIQAAAVAALSKTLTAGKSVYLQYIHVLPASLFKARSALYIPDLAADYLQCMSLCVNLCWHHRLQL